MEKKRCGDCGSYEGELHHYGCDMERCPFCGRQLLGCSCRYTKLGYHYDWNAVNSGLPGDIYKNGLSDEEEEKFLIILGEKGRIPWVVIPLLCAICGKVWPEFFNDPDWDYYVIPPLQKEILCLGCYNRQKVLFPNGWKAVNGTVAQ